MSSSFTNDQSNRQFPQYIQDNAKKHGISPSQYWQIASNLPPSGESPQAGGQGNQAWNTNYSDQQNLTDQNVGRFLQAVKAAGGGQTSTQPPAPANVGPDPTRGLENLGAAALGSVGLGGQAVYNPTPGEASKTSGVGEVKSPTYTSAAVPPPTNVTTPGVFTKAPMPTPTAVTQTQPTAQPNAAQMMQNPQTFGHIVAANAIQQELQRQGNMPGFNPAGPPPGPTQFNPGVKR